MSSLFGSRAPQALPQDQTTRKELIKQQIQQQLAVAHAQELVTKMNEKCFTRCITKPGPSLSSYDETCLSRCMDRWLEAFNVVSKTYVARIAKERSEAGALGGSAMAPGALPEQTEYL